MSLFDRETVESWAEEHDGMAHLYVARKGRPNQLFCIELVLSSNGRDRTGCGTTWDEAWYAASRIVMKDPQLEEHEEG